MNNILNNYDDIGYTCLGDTINIDKKKKVITVFLRRNNNLWTAYAMPLVHRVFPTNFINIMVSVQPMSAPSSTVFHLDYVYGDSKLKVKKWNLKDWFKYIKNEIRKLNETRTP